MNRNSNTIILLSFLFFTDLFAVKCSLPACAKDGVSVCSRCDLASYCGAEHQESDWQEHQLHCQKASRPLVEEGKKSTTESALAIKFNYPDWMNASVKAEADKELKRIHDYFLKNRPKAKEMTQVQAEDLTTCVNIYVKGHKPSNLIVGCGKKPYSWQFSIGGSDNVWLKEKDSDPGDHNHEGAFTIAEDLAVGPMGFWDWLAPIPQSLHQRFDKIYLERLPPGVLAQDMVFTNAALALKTDGTLAFDVNFVDVLFELSDEIIPVSLFEYLVPWVPQDRRDIVIELAKELLLKHGLVFTKITLGANPFNGRKASTIIWATKQK